MNLNKIYLITSIFCLSAVGAIRPAQAAQAAQSQAIQCTEYPGMEIESKTKFECDVIATLPQRIAHYAGSSKTQAESKIDADSVEARVKSTFLSFQQFQELCMHNPQWGYYATQSKIGSGGDFTTSVHLNSPNFGRMIALQAYAMWKSMIYSGDIQEGETFHIIEFGAGEGLLAFDALTWIEMNAQNEDKLGLKTDWQTFNKVCKYVICEKSSFMAKKQTQKNSKFIQSGKLEVRSVDATDATAPLNFKVKALIVSNELPDAFPVHKLTFDRKNNVKVCMMVPLIQAEYLKSVPDRKKISKNSLTCKKLIKKLLQDPEINHISHACATTQLLYHRVREGVWEVLSAQDWLALKDSCAQDANLMKELDKNIMFVEFYIDHRYFPELQNYLTRHQKTIEDLPTIKVKDPDLFRLREKSLLNTQDFRIKDMPLMNIFYVNTKVEDYYKLVDSILETGFVITIDYGRNVTLFHKDQIEYALQAVRTYPKGQWSCEHYLLNHHITGTPGRTDLTTDVNFSDILLIAENLGLSTVYYGPESNLVGTEIRVAHDRTIGCFDLDNPHFAGVARRKDLHIAFRCYKMIISKKTSKHNCYSLLTETEDPFPILHTKDRFIDFLRRQEIEGYKNLPEALIELDEQHMKVLASEMLTEGEYSVMLPSSDNPYLPEVRTLLSTLFTARKLLPAAYFRKLAFLNRAVSSDTKDKPVMQQVVTCGNTQCKNKEENGKTFKQCARCKNIKYCSADCQKTHWKSGHKQACVAHN